MTHHRILPTLSLLALAAALSSCGQSPAPILEAAAPVQAPSSTASAQDGELTSSELTLIPNLFQTRTFSGRVTTMTCTAPWWNQAEMNAQLLANPPLLKIEVRSSKFFLSSSRTITADLSFPNGPQQKLRFSGSQTQGVLKVDGSVSVLENGVNTPFGSGFVLDYDALGQGTAFRGVLDVKVACGTQGTSGPGTTYPGKLFFHTDRV